MRLTLRTLLAWIDGTLGPADQADLGEKVKASGVAPRLVERIGAVVGHPGVTVVSPSGRGLADDPNSAAAFLDNGLDGDLLEAFERICVESDAHLADVAAAHRILAELAADPSSVPVPGEADRRRLLALVATRLEAVRPDAPADLSTAQASPVTASPAAKPSRSRRAPAWAWASAAAALVLLVAAVVLLARSIGPARRLPATDSESRVVARSPSEDRDLAARSPAAGEQPAAAAVPPARVGPDDAPTDAAPRAEGDDAPPTPRADIPSAAGEPPLRGSARQPADDPPERVPPPSAGGAPGGPPPDRRQRVPSGDAMALVEGPSTAAGPDEPAATETSAAEPPSAGGMQHRGGDPLLRLDDSAGREAWFPSMPDQPLADREEFIAPPWCRPVIAIDGIDVRLEPGTRLIASRGADGVPSLEVVFGAAVVSGGAAEARVGIVAGGLRGSLAGGLRHPAAVAVRLDREPGDSAESVVRAAVFAGPAEKVWRPATADSDMLLPPRTAVAWDGRDPAGWRLLPPAEEAWIAAAPAGDRVMRRAAAALAAALAADAAADAAAGVGPALGRLAADRRPENRMIAAATLAMLGDYGELAALVSASPPVELGEAQWTALVQASLPLALARGDASAMAVDEAFLQRGPAGRGELLARLSRGFDDAELAAGGDRLLVESLDDASLAVRRFAIRLLREIVPADAARRSAYRADRPEPLRGEGVAWWRSQLEQGRIRRGEATASPPKRELDGT